MLLDAIKLLRIFKWIVFLVQLLFFSCCYTPQFFKWKIRVAFINPVYITYRS